MRIVVEAHIAALLAARRVYPKIKIGRVVLPVELVAKVKQQMVVLVLQQVETPLLYTLFIHDKTRY